MRLSPLRDPASRFPKSHRLRWKGALPAVIIASGTALLIGSVSGVEAFSSQAAVASAAVQTSSATQAPSSVLTVSLDPSDDGRVVPSGYDGLSLETYDLPRYAGPTTNAAFVRLLANLGTSAGGTVLRLGGSSTDYSTWAGPGGADDGPFSAYPIYGSWLTTLNSVLNKSGATAILGVDLASSDLRSSAAFVQSAHAALGNKVLAYEIGNEPDQYATKSMGTSSNGTPVYARSADYNPVDYSADLNSYASVLHNFAGESVLAAPGSAAPAYVNEVATDTEKSGVGLVTIHAYPQVNACSESTSPPTISSLLADSSSAGLAQQVATTAAESLAKGLTVRVDELNSAGCGGTAGVSDTMASAVWGLDTMFSLLDVGVSGVNFQGDYASPYSPITANAAGLVVHPLYYAQLAFGDVAPPGSRLIATTATGTAALKVWATVDASHTVRLAVLNKSASESGTVSILLPSNYETGTVSYLKAPNLLASDGISIAGQTVSPLTGALVGSPTSTALQPKSGLVSIPVPVGQVALVTLEQ
jgi:hypothetical protein